MGLDSIENAVISRIEPASSHNAAPLVVGSVVGPVVGPVAGSVAFINPSALVAAVARRSKEAAVQLYDSHAAHVRRALVRILGRRAEVDDLLQETFVDAFRNIAELREPERLRSWLFSIAINKARRLLKRERSQSSLEGAMYPIAPMTDDPEHNLLLKQMQELLMSMEDEHRVILVLHYMEDMSMPDMAEALVCSVATVRRKLIEAKSQLALAANRFRTVSDFIERHGLPNADSHVSEGSES